MSNLCEVVEPLVLQAFILEWQHTHHVPAGRFRHLNNYSANFRNQVLEVAKAVRGSYGSDYQEAITYLEGLARNQFYSQATFPDLPWHSAIHHAPGIGAPVYKLHPTVLASLAPGVALRAAFGGSRNVWNL